MGADREEQTAGENLGDRISSKGLSCIPMRVCRCRIGEKSDNQEQWSTSLENRWKIGGESNSER